MTLQTVSFDMTLLCFSGDGIHARIAASISSDIQIRGRSDPAIGPSVANQVLEFASYAKSG
jgi:hypothetical protein